jgi:hypothetical protein
MEINEIEELLSKFRWKTLKKLYGSAHSSIIGFISTEWINSSFDDNSVLDGAPSPKIGKGRKKQTNADLLLCQQDIPLIPVEIETTTDNYEKKLQSLSSYFDEEEYKGIQFGLLVITNLRKDDWEKYHETIEQEAKKQNRCVAIVYISKQKAQLDVNSSNNLRKRNIYYPHDIVTIRYWIRKNSKEVVGIFVEKERKTS